ncbi:MAG: hypothetical protein WCR72_17810 [Bacteroidota bacterium]
MNKPVNTISNLEKLIREKHELKTFCTYQEKLISYKYTEFKTNFPEILTNEVFPIRQEQDKDITSVLGFVNDLVIRFLPERYRKSRFTAPILKFLELLIIRAFSTHPEPKKS